LPVGIIFGTVGIVFLLGNLLHLPGFGEVIFGQEILLHKGEVLEVFRALGILPDRLNPEVGPMMPQEIWVLWFIVLVFGLIGGATVNLLFNIGEEVGWRGFMLVETKSLGFLGSNLIIGGIWGVWMLPLYLMSSGKSLMAMGMWEVMAIVGFAIAIAFPMAYFSIKTRSIYASATFHGVLNNITMLSAFFIWGENELLGSVKGLAGMFVLLLITFLIIRYDQRFVDKYDKWVY
ncbi:MAG: CPBP family glutamic-type intramembrane protease, partial [Bacteroidota bacterium]